MKTKTSKGNSLLLIIIINLSVIFVAVVLAKSDHDHHDHYSDHQHGHKLHKAKKIYYGRRASREEAKFMAAILMPRGGGLTAFERIKCSAVIITEVMLLTAGHCFANISRMAIPRMEVLPGAIQVNDSYYHSHKDLIRNIQTVWMHPNYKPQDHSYDLAVIKVGPKPWPLADDRMGVAQMPVRVIRQRLPLKAYGYGAEDVGGGQVVWGNLNIIEYTRVHRQSMCELLIGRKMLEQNLCFATRERSLRHHHPGGTQQSELSRAGSSGGRGSGSGSGSGRGGGQAMGDSGGGIFSHGTVQRFHTSTNIWIRKNTEFLVGINSGHGSKWKHSKWRQYFLHLNISTFVPWISETVGYRFDTYPYPHRLF